MLIGLGGQNQVMVRDPNGVDADGRRQLHDERRRSSRRRGRRDPRSSSAPGIPSRLWFIDPAVTAVVDSLDIAAVIDEQRDEVRRYALLRDARRRHARPSWTAERTARSRASRLGGGVQKIRIAPGDTTLYALTNVGVVFDIDLKTNTVRRQIIASTRRTPTSSIGRDGFFYLLDGDERARAHLRRQHLAAFCARSASRRVRRRIALSPDGKQIWLTHTQGSISIYQGSVANGFLSRPARSRRTCRLRFEPTSVRAVVSRP